MARRSRRSFNPTGKSFTDSGSAGAPTSASARPEPNQSVRACRRNYILIFDLDQVRSSVRGGSGSPSTPAVQRSPLPVGCPAVSVPELTISPALKGWLGKRRRMATPSSARHKAGLRKLFLPEPSSTNSPFLDMRTLNRGNSSTSAVMPSGRTWTRSPITSAV